MNDIPEDLEQLVDFCNRPPADGPDLFVKRLKGSEMLTFTVYSKSMWGVMVHFYGGLSHLHLKDSARCVGCIQEMPVKWKGYLHGYWHEKRQEVLLEFTKESFKSLEHQLGTEGPLRGNRLQVKRGKGDTSGLVVCVLTAVKDPDQLPDAKNPWPSLKTFYRFRGKGLGDENSAAPPDRETSFY